ncbi:MAG: cell division protein FtsL [Acidobacteriaceae bacterium]|jgi:cell division protein FtsL
MATQAIAAPMIGGLGRGTEWIAEHNAILLAAQRRGRRGPTPEALFTKRIDNSRLVKANDPARGREMRSFAYAMAFLLSLVMVYGWQHFSAIECGYHISAEKQQMQQLDEQNRQLRLTEAQLADPARIDTMAKNLGLTAPQPGQVVRPNAAATDMSSGPVVAESRPAVPAMH